MLVLFESPAGYAIFKVLNEKKIKETDNLFLEFESPERASKLLQLKHFEKFKDMKDALSVATAVVEGKLNKKLKKLLKKVVVSEVQEKLAVADSKLGNAIKEKFDIGCVTSPAIHELMRCIRGHMDSLLEIPQKEVAAMALGLAHSLSRYKLKFSPDKIDTMVIQAISLLDDLDKELNNYIMRCKEWYGWHFPELSKAIADNTVYVKVVHTLGLRTNAATCDLSEVLPEDVEAKVKSLAEVSMGTEVSDEDMINIRHLCEEVIEIQNYRTQLFEYLKNRMIAIAPNLTSLVGELVGARLISHAGSVATLAKYPASTVQILGAEKALFRALKTRQDTPKYGLIYHAYIVGQANPHLKGKVSRMLAGKSAMAVRVDAFGDENSSTELGMDHRAKLEKRIKILEEGAAGRRISGTSRAKVKREKYENKSEVMQYKDADDALLQSAPSTEKKKKKRKFDQVDDDEKPHKTSKKIKEDPDSV